MTGIELIAQERQEQIQKHKYDAEWDKVYVEGELLSFAHYCILHENDAERDNIGEYLFEEKWMNLELKRKVDLKSPLQRLIIAGALIAAEIDRIQKLEE